MRPDKNKAGEPVEALLGTLAALEQDLDQAALFLVAYQRSVHPERSEALRWLLPVLTARLETMRESAGAVDRIQPPVA